MRLLLILVSMLWGLSVVAQTRPANQAELDAFRSHFDLDQVPDWKTNYQILDFEGSFVQETQSGDSLHATVWFRPYLVQGRICAMHSIHRVGTERDGTRDWSDLGNTYYYWKLEDLPCSLERSADRPPNAIVARQPIPSAQVIQTMDDADLLLLMGLDYAINEYDFEADYEEGSIGPERMRALFRRFRDDDSLRLSELGLTFESMVDLGFALVASFSGEAGNDGPVITFSITPSGFVIHGVGYWIE